jgi:uncharacterized repeat protein (TIGR03803 family)
MLQANTTLILATVLFFCFASPCRSGVIVELHVFTPPTNGLNSEGANPAAGLVLSDGLLCGTTVNGGLQGAGTAFYLTPEATEFDVFRSFGNPPDAANSQGDLTLSGNRFFGASFGGGANGGGALFVGQTNGSVSVFHSFSAVSADAATNSGGASPNAVLISAGGTVFGTTTAAGAGANGTVFSLSTNGLLFSVLHEFSFIDTVTGTNADGALPWSGLVLSGDTLFGTASAGGSGGNGVVFSVKTNGSNFTILHNFTPMDWVTATNSEGAIPFGGLILSNDTLYGTTTSGGSGARGTIFSIPTNGLGFTVLHHFSATDATTGTNSDGAAPCATLTFSGSILYGTAPAGGTGASGTIYSVKSDGTQFQTLYSFAPLNRYNGTNSDGAFPIAGLLPVGNSLYGTTFSGGPGYVGTVFRLSIGFPPATITNIVLNSDQTVTLFFVGAPGSTNIIQATANLIAPTWQNLSTNVADAAGSWQFTDGVTNSSRFYHSYAP